jgi:hypothetical protein
VMLTIHLNLNAEVRNGWSHIFLPLYTFMTWQGQLHFICTTIPLHLTNFNIFSSSCIPLSKIFQLSLNVCPLPLGIQFTKFAQNLFRHRLL